MVEPITNESSYKLNTRKDLSEIFSKKEYRAINGDQTFNYNTVKYLINSYHGNLKNKMVQIRTYQDRTFKFFWADQELEVSNFADRKLKAA